MKLPRLQLFEFEDLPWFPTVVRDLATDFLRFSQARMARHEAIVPPLHEALVDTGCREVVDLCSGGTGPVVPLQRALTEAGVPVRFTLTDRYPNLPAFRAAQAAAPPGAISFAAESVDVRAVPADLRGFRTLFNAFHHFAPDDARAILQDAAAAGQPIGIFELPKRSVRRLIALSILTPGAVLLATPFIRPFRWQRLLFTYLLPLVPLMFWWDVIVSHLRAYTLSELEELAAAVEADQYEWRAGTVEIPRNRTHVTYLIGSPTHGRDPSRGERR